MKPMNCTFVIKILVGHAKIISYNLKEIYMCMLYHFVELDNLILLKLYGTQFRRYPVDELMVL